jgi:hypothetical protein
MADQQSRGGKKQGTNNPDSTDQHQGVHPNTTSSNPVEETRREQERREQNNDDPSRAPESGDRK